MAVRIAPGETADDAFTRVRDQLFDYDVFPPWFLHAAICPTGRIDNGATIVQRVMLGPLAVEMAVRVVDVWDRQDAGARESGYSYVTLAGHVERGVVTFAVRQEDDAVFVLMEARSRPGLLLTRTNRPLARVVQVWMTRAGMRRLTYKTSTTTSA